jgi:hypothetical protein
MDRPVSLPPRQIPPSRAVIAFEAATGLLAIVILVIMVRISPL